MGDGHCKASFGSPARKTLGEPAQGRQILARQIPGVDTDQWGCPVLLPFGATGCHGSSSKRKLNHHRNIVKRKHVRKQSACSLQLTVGWLFRYIYNKYKYKKVYEGYTGSHTGSWSSKHKYNRKLKFSKINPFQITLNPDAQYYEVLS